MLIARLIKQSLALIRSGAVESATHGFLFLAPCNLFMAYLYFTRAPRRAIYSHAHSHAFFFRQGKFRLDSGQHCLVRKFMLEREFLADLQQTAHTPVP